MMHSSSPLLPVRVLFLSRDEASVRSDWKLLRGLGVSSLAHIGESAEAVRVLEKYLETPRPSGTVAKTPAESSGGVDIVICDERLADAPVSVFLYRMARHAALCRQPVMVLAGNAESARRLRSVGVYLLERPYTAVDLARMIRKAMSPRRRELKPELFERRSEQQGIVLRPKQSAKAKPAPVQPMTTSDWYAKGLQLLRNEELDQAGRAFERVLDRQEDHIEATLGLARIYRAKGDEEEALRYLLRAAATALRSGEKVFAAGIVAMLPPNLRENVFVHEAVMRMEAGEYRAAALGFLDAAKEKPDQPLNQLVARACLRLQHPETKMKKLCQAFLGMGYKSIAETLYQRMLVYPEFEAQEEPESWLDSYPKIKEALSVMSFAAWAWRHA